MSDDDHLDGCRVSRLNQHLACQGLIFFYAAPPGSWSTSCDRFAFRASLNEERLLGLR